MRGRLYSFAAVFFLFILFVFMQGCSNSDGTNPTSVQNYEMNEKAPCSIVTGHVYYHGAPAVNAHVFLYINNYYATSTYTDSHGYYTMNVGTDPGTRRVTCGNDSETFYHDGTPGSTYIENLYPTNLQIKVEQ